MRWDDFRQFYSSKAILHRTGGHKHVRTFDKMLLRKEAQESITEDEREHVFNEGERATNITQNPYEYYSYIIVKDTAITTKRMALKILVKLKEHEKRIIWLEGFYSKYEKEEKCIICGEKMNTWSKDGCCGYICYAAFLLDRKEVLPKISELKKKMKTGELFCMNISEDNSSKDFLVRYCNGQELFRGVNLATLKKVVWDLRTMQGIIGSDWYIY